MRRNQGALIETAGALDKACGKLTTVKVVTSAPTGTNLGCFA